MAITKYVPGNGIKSSENNANESMAITQALRNSIRQAQDRAIDLEASGGEFVEVYVDSTGRFDSVNTPDINTTAIFDTDKYKAAGTTAGSPGDHDPHPMVNYSNMFDGNDTTFATGSTSSADVAAGKFFARSTFSGDITARVYINNNITTDATIFLEVYDGSTWTPIQTLMTKGGTGAEGPTTYTVSFSGACVGLRLRGAVTGTSKNTEFRYYKLDYTLVPSSETDSFITHTIPSGTFSSTISSSVGTVLHEDWESGSNIQYKFTNATEDSGWLEIDEKTSFTAFTSEPTKLIVKLIPKSSSPTSGYPSIKGVGVIA